MTLSRETMLELMALVDGELEGDAKARAETLTVESEEARRAVDAMRESGLGRLLNDAVEQRARAADGIADAVMGRLEADPGLAGARARWPRTAAVGAAWGSALAIAAAVAIYAGQRKSERAPTAGLGPPAGETSAPSYEVAHRLPDGAGRGVEVEEIDSVAQISIFQISAIANASTPSSVVVWVDDESGEK